MNARLKPIHAEFDQGLDYKIMSINIPSYWAIDILECELPK